MNMQEIKKVTPNKLWLIGDEENDGKVITNYDKCSLKYVHRIDNSVVIVIHSFNYNKIHHYIVVIDGIEYLMKKTYFELSYDLSND